MTARGMRVAEMQYMSTYPSQVLLRVAAERELLAEHADGGEGSQVRVRLGLARAWGWTGET